jgi:methionyl aminopeptidase
VIVCRSQVEIDKLRRVNQLVARILAELRQVVVPGVTTADIDRLAEQRVREAGAEPAFKGYHGYPATVCASVNEQVVHGIPSSRGLVGGDIVSIDMGAKLDGFFGDCAVTVPVGSVTREVAELLRVTEEALFRGIDCVRPGARVSIETGVPVAFGVLTCDTADQAFSRAGSGASNKGREAVTVAVEMANLLRGREA